MLLAGKLIADRASTSLSLTTAVDAIVSLTDVEQEYLVRAWEEAIGVSLTREYWLWVQGQFQGVLPHEVMVCVKFSEDDEIEHIECLRRTMSDIQAIRRLCGRNDGLAVRLARHHRSSCKKPLLLASAVDAEDGDETSLFFGEIEKLGFRNALVHGTGKIRGGGAVFVLLSLVGDPLHRLSHLIELMLPVLYLAYLRVISSNVDRTAGKSAGDPRQTLTARELEIVRWVAEGKTNIEIGIILELSPITIKNRLQTIFRKLGVTNRTQAVLKCRAAASM